MTVSSSGKPGGKLKTTNPLGFLELLMRVKAQMSLFYKVVRKQLFPAGLLVGCEI